MASEFATLVKNWKAVSEPKLQNWVGLLGVALITNTNSQNYQDVWALYESGEKYGGVFIEFGATDGVAGSNTLMLERDWGWTGMLLEPLPQHTVALKANRSANVLPLCVWTESDVVLNFDVVDENDLSTITGYGINDEHAEKRTHKQSINVSTISLLEVVKTVGANQPIDYMSVDTEGSEYDILAAYFADPDHSNYTINTISVEHNYNPTVRDKIYKLMYANGYVRVFEDVSMWDDFYKKETK